MEGPSLIIATEELNQFALSKIGKVSGTAKIDLPRIKELYHAASWGKHLVLSFSQITLRIHFLMFGSYRIDNPRPNRIPKLQLNINDHQIYFYSCAIKEIEPDYESEYDWSVDTMSYSWDPKKAAKKISSLPEAMVCDVLMDQNIFSGVGNIIKNEVLYLLKLHPETKINQLANTEIKKLVRVTRDYCLQFYEWKKLNILKRNWQIFRKKKCPLNHQVIKEQTGKLKRLSHYCAFCQS